MEEGTQQGLPPGQHWGKRWIIYAALGIPKIEASRWRLKVTGLVANPLDLSYDDVMKLPVKEYARDTHCVTGWSIERPSWEGVQMKHLAEMARPRPEGRWVMYRCQDGYTAPVPTEDALHEDSMVALRLNGRPLLPEQGFPARPFMPHLYAWKSAKWLTEIEFISEYRDGYWEMYGYHERGNAAEEERFKGDSGKHGRHRSFGYV